MNLQLATALTFLTLALAMPAPEAEPENPMPVPIANPIENENEPRDIRPAALGLEKRARVSCKIVNTDSAAVNCRYKPSLSSSVIARIPRGSTHTFYCYKRGDCYNGNCTWDQMFYREQICYINGYYTGSSCTAKALGVC
ncbi:hypothetical protein ASPVEDRAFT_45271 [Aspergillus versicolor CBS 583.65]|uniref:Uncharacterized protein n=1 Tax=Aspergillus versicolor CBS 583.65 TaxID=1036611 RepID=A0A1L9PW46_ASPVE|nr:uncharacterized protein ASPVEDRAFT_45271 [Aspergillus versicolor CBS 583.65]OJJ05774.1 hypothetical protein ASPVEDRAFT_45271 [Aspergillus versicolor CBS 583.65]